MQSGTIRAGIGGWTYQPWEGTFYPDDLPKKRQLEYASRRLSTIEVNGTYYGTQKPATFAKWASETPDGFVFSLKGNRFVTNRKVLSEAEDSLARFLGSGITELGDRLGPLLWQFAPTKKFDPEDFEGFLKLLPQTQDGIALRHVLEVRHPSFVVPEFADLARKYGVSICYAHHFTYPEMADVTTDFVYARLQRGDDSIPTAYTPADLDAWAERAKTWAAGGMPGGLPLADETVRIEEKPRDVFVYFIHEGKIRAPQAAQTFIERVAA